MRIARAGISLIAALVFCCSAARAQEQTRDASRGAGEEPIVIRFSHVVGEDTPKGIAARMFQERVEERLGDRVRVEIYPRSQKFDDDEIFLALLFGDVEMGAPSLSKFRSYSSPTQVFDLPFLFADVDHVHRFQEGVVGQQLLQSMLPQDILGLAYWDNGMRVMSATKPVRAPADAEGLLFRIEPSTVTQEQWERIDVATFPMPFSRLVDAIQNGLIAGQANSWSNIHDRGIQRYHKHFTELDESYLGYMVITNHSFWQSLPADIREELEQILGEVSLEERKLAREKADQGKAGVLGAEGAELIELRPDDLEAWQEAWTPLWETFSDEIGRTVIDAALDTRTPQ